MVENYYLQIPFIGGAKNRWSTDLIEAVHILALFRAMQSFGKHSNETAEIIYEGMQRRLAQYPLSRLFLSRLQRQIDESQRRKYPEDTEIIAKRKRCEEETSIRIYDNIRKWKTETN